MAMRITRRRLLEAAGAATVAGALPALPEAALAQETESHGLSTFGEFALPPDFPHFAYVNPKAPKGGLLTVQIKRGGGNQSFDTFNTLNTFVLQGDGAAGMDACFDSLMAGSGDEPARGKACTFRRVVSLAGRPRSVAQLVEHRSPKPRAGGSNPSTPATG